MSAFLVKYGGDWEDIEVVHATDDRTAAVLFLESNPQHEAVHVYLLGEGQHFYWSRELKCTPQSFEPAEKKP